MTRLVFLCALALVAAEDGGRIMRPVDKAVLSGDHVEIIATAPEGRLEVDGAPVAAEQPFPGVLHAKAKVQPGTHTIALIWNGGRTEIRVHTGPQPPADFTAFRQHPPVPNVQCTQCHALSKRGRFVFKGGCFDCHKNEGFAKVHTHNADVLSECGLCHNAHGSITKAHLLHTKELACKQCHN